VRAVGYIRVSTSEQGDSGAGLEAQRRAIAIEIERRGWELVQIFEDQASGKSMNGREGLARAIDAVEDGKGEALVVAKLDRLSRSLMDFAGLMERSRKKRWALVALDLGVDTSTPSGEMLASVLAVFAQFERRMIGLRTAEGLAVKRSQGVRLGRPTSLSDKVRREILRLGRKGLSYSAIARELNEKGVPTAQGGKRWYPATIRKIIVAEGS
jgi:DNA invertase Pin-like site-specific DNA recombinase